MWTESEGDGHEAANRPPLLPPEDRLWRHPAELGPADAPPRSADGVPLEPSPDHRPRARSRGGLVLVGAALVLGAIWFTGGATGPVGDERSTSASGVRLAGTTTPMPASTPPPRQERTGAHDLRGSTGAATPGRLSIEVVDALGPDGAPLGAGIVGLEGQGAAALAGLLPGDVIVAVGGTAVADVAQLLGALEARRPGDTVAVSALRDGASTLLEVRLDGAGDDGSAGP